MKKDPYSIIKSRHITEKTAVLEGLHSSESNVCVRRCETPKFVFIVDKSANKKEIAWAIETIYSERKVKVVGVNTINVKPKPRLFRGHRGKTSAFKKAIVTLGKGDTIETA